MASGVAVIGAVFYGRLGPTRASSVSAMALAMAIDAVIVLAAAGLTLLLPRRAAPRAAGRLAGVAGGRAGQFQARAGLQPGMAASVAAWRSRAAQGAKWLPPG